MSHEESETYQDEDGRWRNYYGKKQAMGLRLPLDYATYPTSGEADAAADIRSQMFPAVADPATNPYGPAYYPGGEPTPFDTLAASPAIANAYQNVVKARSVQEQGLRDKATALEPRITAAQKESDQFAKDIEAHRAELAASRPTITPPPSRKLSEYLAPHEGESPEASVTKLISGLAVFATGIGGLAKGDATAGLAAFKGALEGWHAGDKERADRAFADWHAKTQAALDNWELQRTSLNDWIEAKNMSLDQMLKGGQLEALKWDNQNAAAAFATGTQEAALDYLTKQQNHADQVATNMLRLRQMHEDREAARRAADDRQIRDHDFKIMMAKIVSDKKEADQKAALEAYPDNVLRSIGQQWILDGKPISIGGVRGPAALTIRGKAMKAGLEWAKENGINPEDLPQVRAEVASAKSALTKLRGVDAIQQASIKRFDGHLDALLKLSEKVDRSEMPAINDAILKGQRDFVGSPVAAAYVAQAFEVGMELSRVVVGTAQGDSATREDARKTISAALNKEQLAAVADQLRQNAHRNIESNKSSEKMYTDIVESAGGYKKPKAGAAPSGTWQLKETATGRVRPYQPAPGETQPPAGYEFAK